MARQTVATIDSHGNPGRMGLKRVEQHAQAGNGAFNADRTVFTFIPRLSAEERSQRMHRKRSVAMSSVRQSPTIGRISSPVVDSYGGFDSGFNLLPYPQRSGSGADFPGLARMGAGL